jgi:threonine/homoserine/homoserine lactone efflux protein
MINIFFGGTILGVILSITLGPAFFTLIQTSIDRGFIRAVQIAIGIAISDIVLIVISYMGISTILEVGSNQAYMGIVGGIILIMFGLHTFLKKPEMLKRRSANYKTPIADPNMFTYMGKGFLLNFLNPFLWIFWISAISGLSQQAEPEEFKSYVITFFSGTLVTVFAFDVLKSYIGMKIKKYLKLRTQYYINRIVGLSLIGFGIILLARIFIQ